MVLLPRKALIKVKERDMDTFNLHSFIKEKYSHTRSTHCSALLIMMNCLMQMNKKKTMEDRQLNQKTHFFKV